MEAGWLSKGIGIGGCVAAVVLFGAPASALAGDGTFTQAPGSPLGAGTGAFQSVVADFNADGDEDIATVNSDTQQKSISIALGSAGSSFTAAPQVSLPQSGIAVVASDLDQDGRTDLAVASVFGDAVYFLKGNGDGTFTAGTPISLPGPASNLVVGEFNNDPEGAPDLAVVAPETGANNSDLAVRFYTFSGGSFQLTQSLTTVGQGLSGGMATGDFDQDGREDLAVLVNQTLWVFHNQATNPPTLAAFPQPAGATGFGLASGDFDGDGDPDLVTYGFDSRVLRGASGFTFTPDTTINNGGGLPNGIAVGDFNSDGDLDLAYSVQFGGSPSLLNIYLGGSGTTFASPPNQYAGTTTNSAPGIPAIGDFNGDDNEDIVLPNSGAGSISIFTGGGNPWSAGNLLTLGGIDGIPAFFSSSIAPPAPWTGTPFVDYLRYGSRFGPDLPAAQRWEGGLNFFFGGFRTANSTLSQTVDVSSYATAIDAKQATANLSARLGGYKSMTDAMSVTATFLDANSTNLGSFKIGPVSNTARGNQTGMLRRSLNQPIPAQTRSIVVRLDATQTDGNNRNYASADNLRLFVAAPGIPDPTQPPSPGGDTGDATPPETTIDKGPKRRTEKAKAKIRYSANEPATFQCALKGGKRKLRTFYDCDEAKVKYKHLKPGKKKFQVRAIDAAGNVDPTPAKLKWKVLR
jgi:hypothetical protein